MSNDWSQDPDAWKGESKEFKPGGGADAWKEGEQPSVESKILAYTVAIRPTVDVTFVTEAESDQVKNRDALKLVAVIADGQKVTTEDGELFKYSRRDNLWVRIPWENLD